MTRSYLFLGVAIDVLTEPGAPVAVAEAVLPEGASPPLHVHADLDDSFYVLDGEMVVRCGDHTFLATPGSWIQFPAHVPHTFRVMGGPARILLAQAGTQFLDLVREAGRSSPNGEPPPVVDEPSMGELEQLFADHGIANVGPPLEQDEAMTLLLRLR